MKKILIIVLLCTGLIAEDIDMLLEEFAQKSDLSVETKKDDSGELLLYTRQDLDRMQVRTLKDVMRHIPTFGYSESRQGNPMFANTRIPYASSNQVRMYIDNQEIAIGIFGTSYSVFGNIDLDFVDHIEIYMITPSYSVSPEPNNFLIKLYSKKAMRDEGATASLRYGSRDTHQETISYSQKFDTFNYYAYGTHISENHMPKDSFAGTTITKDKEDIHLFANFQTESDIIQINYLKRDQNPFASVSVSATPLEAKANIEYMHIGYEKDITQNLSLQIAYDNTEYVTSHTDALTLVPSLLPFATVKQFDNIIKDKIVSAKLQYKFNYAGHNISTGIKYKHNMFSNHEELDIIKYTDKAFDKQLSTVLYAEDRYKLSSNNNLIAGVKYSSINNNGGISDEEFLSFRLGYIYNNDLYSSNLFFNHDTLPVSNYIYTTNIYAPDKPIEPQKIDSVTYSLENKDDVFVTKLTLSYLKLENLPYFDPAVQKITAHKEAFEVYSAYMDANYQISTNDAIKVHVAYAKLIEGATNSSNEYLTGYINFFNKFGKINIFNEIYFEDTLSDSVDVAVEYSLGILYRYNDSLELSLKGDNLFYSGKEKADGLLVANPTNGYQAEVLEHQTNDRLILAQVKYFF